MQAKQPRSSSTISRPTRRNVADWNAGEKKDPTKQPARELKLEAIGLALRGAVPAIFNAYRADDIDTAIRLAHQEFKLKLILSTVTEG